MKIAYFAFPHHGGTYTVFRHLRDGLAPAGIDVRWLGVGPGAHRAMVDPRWRSEVSKGAVVGRSGDAEADLVRDTVEAVREGGFDGVFVNVLADRAQTLAVRHMPAHVRRIMLVHNITPGTYAAARAIRDYVHATVGVAPRIRDDLVERFGFDPNWTSVIANGVEPGPALPRVVRTGDLRLLSLGRIDDQAKGVLWLPAILRRVAANVTLTIAGDGPDLDRVRARCARFGPRVRFTGAVYPDGVRRLFETHDVFVAPSRYEGCPLTVVEAMVAGCVPVASHIRGVTDTVIDHERSGLLFPVGDVEGAAGHLRHLAEDPSFLLAMSRAGPEVVRAKFSAEGMAGRYLELIRRVAQSPRPVEPSREIGSLDIPAGLRPGVRTYLPVPVKNFLRVLLERPTA